MPSRDLYATVASEPTTRSTKGINGGIKRSALSVHKDCAHWDCERQAAQYLGRAVGCAEVSSIVKLSALTKTLLCLAALALLAGCGFHLRGNFTLPFKTLNVQGAENTPFLEKLQKALRINSPVSVVADPLHAEAILQIVENQNDKQILSLSAGGRIREFLLTQRVVFRVRTAQGAELIPTSEILVRRDLSFNDSQALAKEAEERLLLEDMQEDIVQQLLRRLSVLSSSLHPNGPKAVL